MITDTRNFGELSAGQIPQYVDRIIYPSKFGLYQEYEVGLTYKNLYSNIIHHISILDKKHMIISVDAEILLTYLTKFNIY